MLFRKRPTPDPSALLGRWRLVESEGAYDTGDGTGMLWWRSAWSSNAAARKFADAYKDIVAKRNSLRKTPLGFSDLVEVLLPRGVEVVEVRQSGLADEVPILEAAPRPVVIDLDHPQDRCRHQNTADGEPAVQAVGIV